MKSHFKLTAGLSFAAAMISIAQCAQAALVTGFNDPNYTTAFQTVSAKTFGDIKDSLGNPVYTIGTGANDLKVYTNTWVDPAGLTFGTLVNPLGTKGNPGQVTGKNPYAENPLGGGSIATNANARDYFYNVTGVGNSPPGIVTGLPANDEPWEGNILDLGGQANKAVVFAILDHSPHPQESLEYTIYMTNKPASQHLSDWTLAVLDAVYLEGWESDSISIADAITTVWKLPGGATFQYVSFAAMGSQALGYGTASGYAPGNDAELDAIAGLSANGLPVPEPGSLLLVGAALAAMVFSRRRVSMPRLHGIRSPDHARGPTRRRQTQNQASSFCSQASPSRR